FGLVFEEHIPEISALYGLTVQIGSLVQRRDDPTSKTIYRVNSIAPDMTASIEAVNNNEALLGVPLKNLLVIKRFGEPIYPTLTPVGSLSDIDTKKPHHSVINGENYLALQLLGYLFE